ncbi:hypothetical protein PUN28_006989 [Cardiocondyla obscurior]|uniref:Uncharacterized protein n=1 Tax=Cardiocondyla obscurior TaxID=286306 RepID=A0AAW2G3Q8_9HYME
MAPYLVPEVINHSPAIPPLGVFLHHNIADRRTVNITWSAPRRELVRALATKSPDEALQTVPVSWGMQKMTLLRQFVVLLSSKAVSRRFQVRFLTKVVTTWQYYREVVKNRHTRDLPCRSGLL